ncbi:hypothetical protein BBJ28_00015515 [Nothophytophthora sp. Chile5]|nr:hypothetical protein BBJ28_00015515 [Nothophytophthora sp. Chile5]
MITASVGVDSSLLLEPARELLFPLPDSSTSRRARTCLTLTNLSPLNDVVFRVRTRNPDAFTVRPTHGLLAPGTSAQVVITAAAKTCDRLGAMDPRDLMSRQSSELFVVQSMEREADMRIAEQLDAESSSSLRAFWKKVPRETSDSADTTAEEASHEVGPLLFSVQPSDMLSFNVKPGPRFWGHSSFFVMNASQTDCLTFKVRTSNQSGYVVKPTRGLVSTTNAQQVDVSLCAPREGNTLDAARREAKDAFLIEVAGISREKYSDLMELDDRHRARELGSLWSLMTPSDRESTMLTVELKMEGSDSDSKSESESSGRADTEARSRSSTATSGREPQGQGQSLEAVVQGLQKLSTVTANELVESQQEEEKPATASSDSDESGFTVSPSVEDNDSDTSSSNGYEDDVASQDPRYSAVIVVSADRMDTVDFSNPEVSFFI